MVFAEGEDGEGPFGICDLRAHVVESDRGLDDDSCVADEAAMGRTKDDRKGEAEDVAREVVARSAESEVVMAVESWM